MAGVPSGLRSRAGGAIQLWRANRPLGTAESVYVQLKSRILLLDLEPGRSLSEPDLAVQYGVSRTPVREALIRLADEGLVDIVPKSGTTVSRIPLALLPEAILVRKALEEMTTRHAAERASNSDILRIEACVLRQEELIATEDFEAFHRADEDFHATIAQAAGFPGVWALVERAKMHIDRFRRLTLPQAGRLPLVVAEHRRVLDAIRRRDPLAAAQAMEAHIDGLEISIENIRNANPDYFADSFG